MEGPRVVLLVILLLFIFFTPDQPARRRFQVDTNHIEEKRLAELDVLTNSSYGHFNPQSNRWLNLSGFRETDGYQWQLLPRARQLSQQQYEKAWDGIDLNDALPIYETVTGEVRGKFSRLDTAPSAPSPNLTAIDPGKDYMLAKFERNITEKEGELSLTLSDSKERLSHEASAIKADISMWTDSSPGNGWQARLQGVHLPSGQIIMSTSSSKFDAWPALAHFAHDADGFNASRYVMNQTVHQLWEKILEDVSDGLAFAPQCELIVWLQPLPHKYERLTSVETHNYLHQVEQELEHPEGAPIGQPPLLTFSATIISPDCGYMLTSDTISGPKTESYWALAQRLIFSFIMALGLQIALLKRQMEKAATPSTRSRIAYQSVVIAALGDGLLLFVLIALLMIDEASFLMVASAAFMACIHVAFLEVKFVFDIWTVQVGDPQRAQQERQIRAVPTRNPTPAPIPTPAPPPATSADGTVGLPLPATAPRPEGATPIILPSDQDTTTMADIPSPRASFAAIYSKFYFSLVMLMFFSLWALSWPRTLRSAYANLLIFCYFSFWWPQIYRNTMRNCRKALSWEYVLGSSLLRPLPILYWYFADHNILSIDTSPTTAVMLLGWLWLQVAILASQQFLGPRLLVQDSWCPPAYDYHPILREDDVEANGMSIGLLASASEAKDQDDKTRKVFDCAICMNEIDVPVISKADGTGGGTAWLEQRNYMVTPCRHIFHAECLEGWMNLRLVCPVCREGLPPL
ncbi:hypothetical protein LTR92_000932 [Exophiala xenobiotica]|nr:hypothetical protein LTR92_000932 [Exophiala xenobiotica]